MRTEVLQGSKQQIAQQMAEIKGHVVRALIFVEDPPDNESKRPSELDAELDALMALGSENTTPADVSREAMYSPATV